MCLGANADTSYRGWYRLCVACWIILGLSWLSGLISVVQTAFNSVTSNVEDKIKRKPSMAATDEKQVRSIRLILN